jgi:hypothetical protein
MYATTPLEIATYFTGVDFGVGRTTRGRSETNGIETGNSNLGQDSVFCYCIAESVLYNALYSRRKHTLTMGPMPTPNCLTIIRQLGLTEFTSPLASAVRLPIPSVVGFPSGVGVSSVLTDLAAFSLARVRL